MFWALIFVSAIFTVIDTALWFYIKSDSQLNNIQFNTVQINTIQ